MRVLFGAALAVAALAVAAAQDAMLVRIYQPRSEPVTPNFASFSVEISDFLNLIGVPARASYVQLLENLRAMSQGPGPQIRIGGDSSSSA
eukprot:m.266497 g.266497  ORF g.266497 m.266497 type:complete len:90 (+) comp31477_c0_seq1:279-548(+)